MVPIGIPTICWKTFPEKKTHENVVYQKTEHLDDVIFSVLASGVSVPSQNLLLSDPILDICICGYRF